MRTRKVTLFLMLSLICLFADNAIAHSSDYTFNSVDYPRHFPYTHDHYPSGRQSRSHGYQPRKYNHHRPPINNGCFTKPRYPENRHRHNRRPKQRLHH